MADNYLSNQCSALLHNCMFARPRICSLLRDSIRKPVAIYLPFVNRLASDVESHNWARENILEVRLRIFFRILFFKMAYYLVLCTLYFLSEGGAPKRRGPGENCPLSSSRQTRILSSGLLQARLPRSQTRG